MRLATQPPARSLSSCIGSKSFRLRESNSTELLRRLCLARRHERIMRGGRSRERRPRRHRILTKSSRVNKIPGLSFQTEHLFRPTIDCIAIDDQGLRNHVGLRRQRIYRDCFISDEQNPLVIRTQTAADPDACTRQFRDTRLGKRTGNRDEGYVIQISIRCYTIRRTPCEIFRGIGNNSRIFTKIIRILYALSCSLDGVDRNKRTQIVRIGHHTENPGIRGTCIHIESSHDLGQTIAGYLRRNRICRRVIIIRIAA